MAFYNQNQNQQAGGQGMNAAQDDEEQKQQQQAAAGGAAPVQLTSASANNVNAAGGAAPAAPAATGPKKPASSGMAAGFQAYAKANQGTATNRLSNAATANVNQLGQQANKSISQATNKFGQKVEAGSLANRHQAVQDVANAVDAARNLTAPPKPAPNAPVRPDIPDAQNIDTSLNAGRAEQKPEAPAQAPDPLSQMEQGQLDRFKEIINARYKGPESLRQAGLYNPVAAKVDVANQAIKNTGTAQGREELLRSMYEKRGDYTRGLNKLDTALLNSSKDGVANLQAAAKDQGNLSQRLDQAQLASANQAKNRTQEIADIRGQARDTFSQGKSAEEAQTEQRLDGVKDQWEDLPEYYRNIIRNKEETNKQILQENLAPVQEKLKQFEKDSQYQQQKANLESLQAAYGKAFKKYSKISSTGIPSIAQRSSAKSALSRIKKQIEEAQRAFNPIKQQHDQLTKQINDINANYNPNAIPFNELEAAMLGVGSGEGLYNLGTNAIQTGEFDRERLISRDEQIRQAALAAMAGLDQSNELDTNLRYADVNKAGTRSILDSLDLEATRKRINEAEEGFRNTADKTNLTGHGHKKVSRGNAFGKSTENYYAQVSGNTGDFLRKAGYDFDRELGTGQNIAAQKDLLNAALQASHTNRADTHKASADKTLAGTAQGAATGASIGSVVPGVGTGIGAAVGAGLGTIIGGGTIDPVQNLSNLLQGYAPGVGQAMQDVRGIAGDIAGAALSPLGSFGSGIASAIGGIDKGAMKAFGSAVAKDHAIQDLNRQYSNFLNSQGFKNRTQVVDNDAVKNRIGALEALLANLDKTNT